MTSWAADSGAAVAAPLRARRNVRLGRGEQRPVDEDDGDDELTLLRCPAHDDADAPLWLGRRFRAGTGDISFTYFLSISLAAGRYFGEILRPRYYNLYLIKRVGWVCGMTCLLFS